MKKQLFAVLIGFLILTNWVSAHDNAGMVLDSITVIGNGVIEAEPDMLDLRVDFFAIQKTLKGAKTEVDQRYQETIKTIKKYNIADRDIKLTRINSQLEYDWSDHKRIFKGYRVSRNLQISIREIDVYPELLQALVNAGISNISNATPRFADETSVNEKALEAAVESAKRKAQSLAKQFGRQLGEVTFVSEGNVSSLRSQPVIAHSRSKSMSLDSAQAVPPAMFGTQRVNANVTVIYRLQ